MPNFTPLLGLPYPSALDAPCDFDEQWCDFTQAVDGWFDQFEAALARTNPAVPAAMLALTAAVTIDGSNPIPYTEVLIDTAAMTDLDADPYAITCRRSARYTVAGWVDTDTRLTNSQMTLLIEPGIASGNLLDRGTQAIYFLPAHSVIITLAEGDRLTLSALAAVGSVRTFRQAWLSVVWHSDVENP